MEHHPMRTGARRILMGLGAALLVVSLLAGYVQVTLISDAGFADNATAALDHQDVRTALSQVIVSRLMTKVPPGHQFAQPILEQSTATVLNSNQFETLFRATVLRTHHAILSERNNQVVLNLSREASTVLGVLATIDPQLAQQLQPAQTRLQKVSQSNALLPVIRGLQRIRWIEILAPILSAACFLLAIFLGVSRRRALRNVGIAIAIPGAIVWLLLAIGQWAVPRVVSGPFSLALPGLWDAFLGDLRRWSLVLTLVGLAIVAIANASSRTMDLTPRARRLWAWVMTPDPGSLRVPLIGVAAVVMGLLVLFDPMALFRLLLVLAGAAAVYWGTYEALQHLARVPSPVTVGNGQVSEGPIGAARWSAIAVVAVAVFLLWARNIWFT